MGAAESMVFRFRTTFSEPSASSLPADIPLDASADFGRARGATVGVNTPAASPCFGLGFCLNRNAASTEASDEEEASIGAVALPRANDCNEGGLSQFTAESSLGANRRHLLSPSNLDAVLSPGTAVHSWQASAAAGNAGDAA